MRTITVIVYEQDDVRYDNEILGYEGESGATTLDVCLPSDWTGNFYVDWKVGGEWIESEEAYTATDFEYEVPDEAIVKGDVFMRVRIIDGDTTAYTETIKFVVR